MPIDGPFPKPPQLPRGAGGTVRQTETIPRGSLQPERLRRILHRLARGAYDHADVHGRIAARVGAALDTLRNDD